MSAPQPRAREPVRAVLFDLDGTLYHALPLRAAMALELASLPLARRSLAEARREWRAVAVFRRVREELRQGPRDQPLDRLQYTAAAARAGVETGVLEAAVREWIYRRPLKWLRACRRRGLAELLAGLAERGIPAGVFSDHPVRAKLEALGVASAMEVQVCATDPDVDAFKPDPRGFLHACRALGHPPERVLYVGDRPEVDAVGAARAGMPCAIVARGPTFLRRGDVPGRSRGPEGFALLSSFAELLDAIDHHRL